MDTTTRTGSPLRQRMIEDMRMRKLETRTQEGYISAVGSRTQGSQPFDNRRGDGEQSAPAPAGLRGLS